MKKRCNCNNIDYWKSYFRHLMTIFSFVLAIWGLAILSIIMFPLWLIGATFPVLQKWWIFRLPSFL